jgi:hypothetical protein
VEVVRYVLLSLATAVIYPILATSLYMLGSRDKITVALWSRYPAWLDSFMTCAACSGTWYGAALAVVGAGFNLPFLGLPGPHLGTIIVVALYTKVLTPIIAAKHVAALLYTSDDPQDPGTIDIPSKE